MTRNSWVSVSQHQTKEGGRDGGKIEEGMQPACLSWGWKGQKKNNHGKVIFCNSPSDSSSRKLERRREEAVILGVVGMGGAEAVEERCWVGRHVFVPELGGDFCDVYFFLIIKGVNIYTYTHTQTYTYVCPHIFTGENLINTEKLKEHWNPWVWCFAASGNCHYLCPWSHADATHHELQSPVPRTVWEGPVQVCSLVRMSCLEGQVTSTALYMQLARPGVY